MICSNSPKCKKPLPARPFACINCGLVKYCSPQCRKKNRASHLKSGCPPPGSNRSLVEVCEQIGELDEGTKIRLNSEMYQRDIKEGYRWYLEWSGRDRSASNFTPEAEWALLYISIIQKLDRKIHVNHGIVHWKDGNRANCQFSNVYFIHLCDALVHLESGCAFDTSIYGGEENQEEGTTSNISGGESRSRFRPGAVFRTGAASSRTKSASNDDDTSGDKNPVTKRKSTSIFTSMLKPGPPVAVKSPPPELNLLDDMTNEEITFLKENSDFLWIVYGKYANHSEIPIYLTPSIDSRNSRQEFQTKKFQLAQKQKKRMYNEDRRNVAFCDFIAHMSGQMVPAIRTTTHPTSAGDFLHARALQLEEQHDQDKKPKAKKSEK